MTNRPWHELEEVCTSCVEETGVIAPVLVSRVFFVRQKRLSFETGISSTKASSTSTTTTTRPEAAAAIGAYEEEEEEYHGIARGNGWWSGPLKCVMRLEGSILLFSITSTWLQKNMRLLPI